MSLLGYLFHFCLLKVASGYCDERVIEYDENDTTDFIQFALSHIL